MDNDFYSSISMKLKQYFLYQDYSEKECNLFIDNLIDEDSKIFVDEFIITGDKLKHAIYNSKKLDVLLFAAMYVKDIDKDVILDRMISIEFFDNEVNFHHDIACFIKFANYIDNVNIEKIEKTILHFCTSTDCMIFYKCVAGLDYKLLEKKLISNKCAIDMVNYIKVNPLIDKDELCNGICSWDSDTVLKFLKRKGDININIHTFLNFAFKTGCLEITELLYPLVKTNKCFFIIIDTFIKYLDKPSFYECELIEELFLKNLSYKDTELINLILATESVDIIQNFLKRNKDVLDINIFLKYFEKNDDLSTFEMIMIENNLYDDCKDFENSIIENQNYFAMCALIKNDKSASVNKLINILFDCPMPYIIFMELDFNLLLKVPDFFEKSANLICSNRANANYICTIFKNYLKSILTDKYSVKLFDKFVKFFIDSCNPVEIIKFINEFSPYINDLKIFEDAITQNFNVDCVFEYLSICNNVNIEKFRNAFINNTNELSQEKFFELYPL